MQNLMLFAHSGSKNHGCEAIVRGMYELLGFEKNCQLLSKEPEEDLLYGVDQLLPTVRPHTMPNMNLWYKIRSRLSGDTDRFYYEQLYKNVESLSSGKNLALSIGGDNYCYAGLDQEISILHNHIRRAGVKTALVGCSVEIEKLSATLKSDILSYDCIIARESLTFQALKCIGVKNLHLLPDPAFAMQRIDLPLPFGFVEGNTVGINVSPLIQKQEKKTGITLQNYLNLVRYILEKTQMNVALIPHVVWEHNDDRKPLQEIYHRFAETGRVVMIADCNAKELKGYIARCRFVVTARTHASIAAYSQCVPTLVVGYSIKARGLACDLFGTENGYVIPVQSLSTVEDLVKGFEWLMTNEADTREQLMRKIPEYTCALQNYKTILSCL